MERAKATRERFPALKLAEMLLKPLERSRFIPGIPNLSWGEWKTITLLALDDKAWNDLLGKISRESGSTQAIKTGDPLIDELEEALARGEDYGEASRRILG